MAGTGARVAVSTGRLHVLDSGPAPGAWNLALDEALLEDTRCWLRFYRWVPACLSLGYFQRWADFADLPAELPRVRRPTGGGAILHDGELTLSLALPETQLPREVRKGYELLNEAILAALAVPGVRIAGRQESPERRASEFPVPHAAPSAQGASAPATDRDAQARDAQKRDAQQREAQQRDPQQRDAQQREAQDRARRWCFFRPTGLDLVVAEGAKLFGSAQRRRNGRVLHHGSLVLERNAYTPFTAALSEWRAIDWSELTTTIAERLATSLGLTLARTAEPPDELAERARALEAERYGAAAWNRLR